jgi:hypothetical protein
MAESNCHGGGRRRIAIDADGGTEHRRVSGRWLADLLGP